MAPCLTRGQQAHGAVAVHTAARRAPRQRRALRSPGAPRHAFFLRAAPRHPEVSVASQRPTLSAHHRIRRAQNLREAQRFMGHQDRETPQ
jgi:hypothetical protein